MKPRILLAAALAAVPLTAAVSIPDAGAAKAERCDQRGGTTLVATPGRRVFTTSRPVKGDPDAATLRLFVCRPGSRVKPRQLERFNNNLDGIITPEDGIITSNRWLLIQASETTGTNDAQELRLYDLKTARMRSIFAQDGAGKLDVVLTAKGAFAVNDPTGGVTGFDNTLIHPLAPPGAKDLAARGSRVYWTAGGVAASSTLGSAPKGPINND